MENAFLDQIKKRRSIYSLGDKLSQTPEQLTQLIQDAIKHCPSAFNAQSSRAVILFGEHHHKVWDITKSILQGMVEPEAFKKTESKVDNSFRAGFGTVLFYIDTAVVKSMQEKFPSYADNFPTWSEHSAGLTQFSVWTALASAGIGASLQHYNPLIDEAAAKEWGVPESWKLRAQMPFGSIQAPAGDKSFMDDAERFRVFT